MEKPLINVPGSVALIMDGNGRWAKKRGLPRTAGHKEGAKTVEKLLPEVGKLGIRYFTVYAFSTENWNRSPEEVDALMQLFRLYAPRLLKMAVRNNVRVRFIGDRNRFDRDIIQLMDGLEKDTEANTGLCFAVAANYGGRDEIRRAAAAFAEDVKAGKADPAALDEQLFKQYLDTHDIPDPDLIIRTSGEYRLSNFLLWEAAYAEYVATDVLFPDFDREELIRCIEAYNCRHRRFGGV